LFIEALSRGERPRIHGDGQQTRDFTYVADVVNGVLKCCTADRVSGQVLNVAVGGRISLLELVKALQTIMHQTAEPVLGPPRDGDVKDSQADIAKARQLLDFAPETTFEDGLRATVAWYETTRATASAR
jgi:nucleoside-diphosphate-sugar epimerase